MDKTILMVIRVKQFMAIWIKQLLWRYGDNGDMDKTIVMAIWIKQF